MKRPDTTINNPIISIRIQAYKNTRNLCLIRTINGIPAQEMTVEVHDFLPFNYAVADTKFLPEFVRECFEGTGLGREVLKYYQDGIEYPVYEINMGILKEWALSDYADYLTIRAEHPCFWLTKEEIAEKMDQVRSNIIKEKCDRASELVRESLSR